MLNALKKLIGVEEASTDDREHDLRLATAALFVEMTRADFDVGETERQAAAEALRTTFDLTTSEATEILESATRDTAGSIEVFQFTRVVDQELEPADKVEVVQRLWEVAFADDRIDEQEEYLVRKIARLLHVSHGDFIAAKKRARDRRAGDGVQS